MSAPETATPENPPDQPENPAETPENPAETTEKPAETPEKPPESAETPSTDNENKPPDLTTDKPTSKPEKPVKSEKPHKPAEPPSSETLLDILKDKWNSIYHNPYRMRIIMCTIIFFLALEVARELRNIAFPLRLYKPFKKIGECIKCITKILSG